MSQVLTPDQMHWIKEFTGVQLDAEPGTGATGGGRLADEVAGLRKLVSHWQAAEAEIQSDVGKLRAALKEFFDGDEAQASMEKEFEAHVSRLFKTLDTSLKRELEEAASVESLEALEPIKAQLGRSIDGFMQQISAHETISLFDDNPYVKLSLRATCDSALGQMASHLA